MPSLYQPNRDELAELLSDEPMLGLQREAGYMWGTLRDEDGELYSVMRRIAPPGAAQGTGQSLAGKLLVVSSGTHDGQLQLRREPRGAADSTEIERRPHNDNAVRLAPRTNASGRTMQLVLSEDEFSYVEEGVIDVAGRIVVPPLQWYLPGPQSSLLYISHTWLVDQHLQRLADQRIASASGDVVLQLAQFGQSIVHQTGLDHTVETKLVDAIIQDIYNTTGKIYP